MKQMNFKDFAPQDVTPMIAITRKYERIEDVVARANDWIATSGATLINVETLILPKSLASSESSGNSVAIEAGPAIMSQWLQVVRIWYSAAA
jgi:hypothetical protein